MVEKVIEIRDSTDPRVDDYRDLTTADRRPDRPGGRGLVIAEGVVVVRRMLESPYPVRSLLGIRRRIEALAPDLAPFDIPVYAACAEVMAEVVGFHLNRGVLAVADRPAAVTPGNLMKQAQLLAVLEGVGDHENLGSIFRNAAALGVSGVLLGPGCSDPLYRRSVRVSMGHVLRVPFAAMPSWPAGLEELRDNGFQLIALTPAASAMPLSKVVFAGRRTAVLLGSEGYGLTERTLSMADMMVRIPMVNGVDSLNVATAAAVAFYAVTASG